MPSIFRSNSKDYVPNANTDVPDDAVTPVRDADSIQSFVREHGVPLTLTERGDLPHDTVGDSTTLPGQSGLPGKVAVIKIEATPQGWLDMIWGIGAYFSLGGIKKLFSWNVTKK